MSIEETKEWMFDAMQLKRRQDEEGRWHLEELTRLRKGAASNQTKELRKLRVQDEARAQWKREMDLLYK